MRYTPENIETLGEDEVFVFGSNLAGVHGAGAARLAHKKFGYPMGMGHGPNYPMTCYAIPTKDRNIETLPIEHIRVYVDELRLFTIMRPDRTFLITQLGCGLAGYTPADIAPLFKDYMDRPNVTLPKSFVEVLQA
jgi:hypothetical protein